MVFSVKKSLSGSVGSQRSSVLHESMKNSDFLINNSISIFEKMPKRSGYFNW